MILANVCKSRYIQVQRQRIPAMLPALFVIMSLYLHHNLSLRITRAQQILENGRGMNNTKLSALAMCYTETVLRDVESMV